MNDGATQALEFYIEACMELVTNPLFQTIFCSGAAGSVLEMPIGTGQVSDAGSFTSLVVTDENVSVTSASLTAEAPSDCSAPTNLP